MSVHWCAPRVGQNKIFEKANTCTLYVLWLKKTCNFYFESRVHFNFKSLLWSHRSRAYLLHSHNKFIQLRFSVITISPQFWIICSNIIPFVVQSRNALFLWKNEGQHSLQKSPSILSLLVLKYLIHIFTSCPYFYGSPQSIIQWNFRFLASRYRKFLAYWLRGSWEFYMLHEMVFKCVRSRIHLKPLYVYGSRFIQINLLTTD